MDKFSEFLKSIFDSFENRLTNPLYGTFVVTWILTNWRLVYSVLFLDQAIVFQKSGLLKNEYIWNYFFIQVSGWWQVLDYFIIPVVLTILIIWIFPKYLFLPAIKEDGKYETERIRLRLIKEDDINELRASVEIKKAAELKAVAEQKKSEVEIKEAIKEADPTIEWEQEYQNLKKRNIFSNFRTLYQIVYENDGGIYGQQSYILARPLIAYLDSIGALTLRDGSISLKPKGNFFMRKYLEEIS